MKRICLFVVCLNSILLFLGPKADAGIRALAAVPNPIAGAAVLPNKHRHVSVIKDSNGAITKINKAGIFLVVNAAVVADGYGQVAMLTSGELKQAGKTDAVATLSEGQTIEDIGWNLGLIRINQLQAVYCTAVGEYIASTKAQTGDFTLEGESIYATTRIKVKNDGKFGSVFI